MTKEKAIDIFKCLAYRNLRPSEEEVEEVDEAIKALEQEPKIGHWIKSNIPNEEYVCSECGGSCWYYDYQASVAKSRYCPNCGAKMEG